MRTSLDGRPLADRLEQPTSRRFSPLCQRVLQREYHAGLRRQMPLLPVASERLHHAGLAKDVEALIAQNYRAEDLQALIDLAAGDQLITVLTRHAARLGRLGFEPIESAALIDELHNQDKLDAQDVERRIIALVIVDIRRTSYETINQQPLGPRVLRFIDHHCHRLYRLPLTAEVFEMAAIHPEVLAELSKLMSAWSQLSQWGLSEKEVATSLSCDALYTTMREAHEALLLEDVSQRCVSYAAYVAACAGREDSATNEA